MNTLTSPRGIRSIAIGLIWKDKSLLVQHGLDPANGETFFRPPGGAIEFGERAAEALRREFREEFNAELSEPQLVTVVENLFEYDAQQHHEVVFIFEAQFTDHRLYERSEFTIQESNLRATASWKSLEEIASGAGPLYPDGLMAVLKLTELANRPLQPTSGAGGPR